MNVGMKCEAHSIWHLHRQDLFSLLGVGGGVLGQSLGCFPGEQAQARSHGGVSAVLVSGVSEHGRQYTGVKMFLKCVMIWI